MNIRSAGSPTFSPDGKRIAFLTNITGTNQIWFVDAAGGYPEQITAYADNVSFVRWSPKGNGLIFGKAVGGDENTQFYWMSNDGAEIKQLTNAPKIRHNFGAISEDGTKIYYASNKRNPNFFDIYSMTLSDSKEELIYQQDGSNSFAAVDAFGRKIVVSRSGTELSLDNNLYLFDVESKKEILLTKHEGSAQFGGVNFTADGIVFAHNDKREFYSLAQMRQKNASGDDWSDANREVKILDASDWDIDEIEMQTYGNTLAYTLNREGFSEFYLRKYETGGKPLITTFDSKSESVKLPAQGIVGGLTFSDDGKKLAFSFSSAKHNGDIWVYDLEKKSLTQVTKSSRSGIPQSSFVEPQLIKYKTFDGKEIRAWFYIPTNVRGSAARNEGEAVEYSSYRFYKSDTKVDEANRIGEFIFVNTPHSVAFNLQIIRDRKLEQQLTSAIMFNIKFPSSSAFTADLKGRSVPDLVRFINIIFRVVTPCLRQTCAVRRVMAKLLRILTMFVCAKIRSKIWLIRLNG